MIPERMSQGLKSDAVSGDVGNFHQDGDVGSVDINREGQPLPLLHTILHANKQEGTGVTCDLQIIPWMHEKAVSPQG